MAKNSQVLKTGDVLTAVAKANVVVTHPSPIGEVSFVVTGKPLKKSYISAHYRHDAKGKLVFVHGYHNKVFAKPEDLTAEKIGHQLQPHAEPPVSSIGQKYQSFRYGDEVFVKYSHMHDQHYLLGAVVGIRDDKSHGGILIGVRLLNGYLDYYRPNSLVHVHKTDYEERGYEVSHHKDPNGKPIDYKHLTPEQKQFFYDQYKLWFRLQRMGELKAFNDNKSLFVDSHGKLPESKKDLTAEQKIQLEKLNEFPVVPYEAIISTVGTDGYDKAKHYKFVKELMDSIDKMQKNGVPEVQFPKLYKKKGKKEIPYTPPEWMGGLFPSSEGEELSEEEFKQKMAELNKLVGSAKPSTAGPMAGNYKDFYHGQPIIHGQVKTVDENGPKYPVAPKLPSPEDSVKANFGSNVGKKTTENKKPVKKHEDEIDIASALGSSKEFYDESDISNLKFSVHGNANAEGFGGAHSKYILTDAKGNKYLFKPYNAAETYRAWSDIAAHNVAKAIGLPTAEFGSKPISIKIPSGLGGSYSGKTAIGSVQRIVSDIKSNNIAQFSSKAFENAPHAIIEQLQKEQVLDWLLGNNDNHAGQFLIDKDGNIVGVDKGHSFKFYKDDVLSLDYDPAQNAEAGFQSVYHIMFGAAKNKKLDLDWNVVKNFINKEVKNLAPADFANAVYPYASTSVKWLSDPQQFQALAISRLENLENDFKQFYKSCGINTGDEQDVEPVSDDLDFYKHQPDAFQQIDSHFHERVINAKAMGCSIMLGGGQIEDMSVHFTPYEWDFEGNTPQNHTGKGLQATFNVMAGSESSILPFFDTIEDSDTKYTKKQGTLPVAFDPLATAVINAARTINHHAPNGGKNPDGKYNAEKIDQFAKWFQNKDSFDPSAPLASPQAIAIKLINDNIITPKHFDNHITLAHNMAQHYHKIGAEILEAAKTGSKTSGKNYQAWNGEYISKSTNVSDKKHPWAVFPRFQLKNGRLVRIPGESKANHSKNAVDFGCVFKKNLDGNISVSYYPHYSKSLYGQNNYRSQQGRCVIDFSNWDGNVNSMYRARKVLHQVGLDHHLANHKDVECLYLTRTAWHNNADVKYAGEWKKIQSMPNNETKIAALKDLCEKSYGIAPDKLSTYMPMPRWDNNNGHHYFLNPYVLQHLKDNPDGEKWYPIHQLKAGTDNNILSDLVDYGLLSTEFRRNIGMPYYGMSTTEDQVSGGASYVFTSGRYQTSLPHQYGISDGSVIFRPELMARTDCFTYPSDSYGVTHDKGVSGHGSIQNRIPIGSLLKGKAGDYGKTTNVSEIMFKNRIPFENWLMAVKAANPTSSEYGAVVAKWIKNLREFILKKKPHLFNHAQFIGYNE